jgi:hypothetical protein
MALQVHDDYKPLEDDLHSLQHCGTKHCAKDVEGCAHRYSHSTETAANSKQAVVMSPSVNTGRCIMIANRSY